MMGVTSLEVYNTVYNITEKNNKLEIHFTQQQLKSLNVDTELQKNVFDYSNNFYDTETLASYNEFIENTNESINNSCSKNKKLTRYDLNRITSKIEDVHQDAKFLNLDIEGASRKDQLNSMNILEFEFVHDHFGIELPPGVYELVDINRTIKQKLSDSDYEIEFNRRRYNINEISLNIFSWYTFYFRIK